MSASKMHITHRSYPKTVGIIYGAPQQLVDNREKFGQKEKYETNRNIKYWSTWFLLKSLTTTSYIQDWTSQKKHILDYVQMGVKTFKKHLQWLQDNQLLYIEATNTNSLRMVAYEDAARKLGIEYTGNFQVAYDPHKNKNAKQTFQYLIRTEEFEHHKQRQVDAIMRKLEENPSLKKDVMYYIGQMGADYNRLVSDSRYFVHRLLMLQSKMFREGSEFLEYIMQYRADVNRGVIRIKAHHRYRSKQSVSYMKKKMREYGYAIIEAKAVESRERSRLYVPANEETPKEKIRKDGLRDGYIYIAERKATVWRLCDQVRRNYNFKDNLKHSKTNRYAA